MNSVFSANVRVIHVPLFEAVQENWLAPADQSPGATAVRYAEMLQDGLPALAAVVVRSLSRKPHHSSYRTAGAGRRVVIMLRYRR